MTINKNRQIERAAVNAFRTLMERHNFIVQEIDGGNDHGEDVYVSFTEDMKRTGDTIFVQIKGGHSCKTTEGYRVLIEKHREYWEKSNAPIFCVVQDPDTQSLYWANASAQLRETKGLNKAITSIRLNKEDVLNDETITTFALRARLYIAEVGDFHKFLTKISGVEFDVTDYLAYFENRYSDQIIFRQEHGESKATLLHSDFDWTPVSITLEDIAYTKPAHQFPAKKTTGAVSSPIKQEWTLNKIILSKAERMWVEACFQESNWIREHRLRNERDILKSHCVLPILYAPWQEQEVANKAWRNKPEFDELMEKFIYLGYEYWNEVEEYYGKAANSKPVRSQKIVWDELRDIVKQLKGLGTPHYYLMSNRGRLSRTEFQQIYSSIV